MLHESSSSRESTMHVEGGTLEMYILLPPPCIFHTLVTTWGTKGGSNCADLAMSSITKMLNSRFSESNMQVGGRTLEVFIFLPLGHACSTPCSSPPPGPEL